MTRDERELARLRREYLRILGSLQHAMASARTLRMSPDSPPWTRAELDAASATGRAWFEVLAARKRYDEARRRSAGD